MVTVPHSNDPWHMQEVEAVLQTLESNVHDGLTDAVAAERLARYGPNELEERGGKNPLLILWEQFSSTMVVILIIAAVISGFLGKPLETVAISAIVVLFAVLGFVQEYRAERAIAALKQLAVPAVRVHRNGLSETRSAKELVPGDIVLLEAGSAVPADLRLVESSNLMVQESALTGESEAVEKYIAALSTANLPLGDRRNMAYMGTSATYGRGTGVVIATGMRTELGRIAELIQDVEQQETPLQRQLSQVGTLLAVGGVIAAVLVMIIGVLQGEEIADMFLTAVSVAVAVVPEGLPAVVTLTLALGAQRMLRRRALIRKLPAVETLGSVSIICSDKTGTLTENRMTVTILDVAGHHLELTGTSKTPVRTIIETSPKTSLIKDQPPSVALLLMGGALCNDAALNPDPKTGRVLSIGDPTEGALLVAAIEAGLDHQELQTTLPRLAEVPFDSVRKRMTTIHQLPDDLSAYPQSLSMLKMLGATHIAITKGSFDGLVDVSSRIWEQDHPEAMDDGWHERIKTAHDKMALNGMRVLGVTIKPLNGLPEKVDDKVEDGLIFLGLVGMIDPPRPEVKAAIQKCKSAGIRPIMITGDHPLTARFIAHELGISDNGRVKTGNDLDQMSHDELADVVQDISVYARVTPEHKLRIVDVLQKKNNVVAMTGDGVNDSPALKKADIGVAMGITGTDVSKEAAQMVLLDDNFATIVAAVEEGRAIYENIRRFVKFSIAGNLGKVIVMLFAPLLGITLALLPLQLLWLNLLTDGLLGLGLGVEAADKKIMTHPPRKKGENFLSAELVRYVVSIGVFIGVVALGLGYAYYSDEPDARIWQTMIFSSIAFMQIGQALAARSIDVPFFELGWRSNPTLLLMVISTFLLQVMVIYAPFLKEFFHVTPLTLAQFLICLGTGVALFIMQEVQKQFRSA